MMMRIFWIVMTLCIWGCSATHRSTTKSTEVDHILAQVYESHGGIDNWRQKSSISFDKEVVLYASPDIVENQSQQRHHYTKKVQKMMWTNPDGYQVSYLKSNDGYRAICEDPNYNNPSDTKISSTLDAATFVANIPFCLDDHTAKITYLKERKMPDGRTMPCLQVVYDTATYDHHTTDDVWWYYIDPSTHLIAAYEVQHADHVSFVTNDRYTEVGGFYLIENRRSYRLTDDRHIDFLRATYQYRNYEIEEK